MKMTITVILALIILISCSSNQDFSFGNKSQTGNFASDTAQHADSSEHKDTAQLTNTAQKTNWTILDSIGLVYNLVKEKTLEQFVKAQGLEFKVLPDTVINDERGVIIGKKLVYNQSSIQWMNDSSVSHLKIRNPEIKLNYGIHCGMTRNELIIVLKLQQMNFDTLTFESGFLNNQIDFYFSDGKLKAIYLENLPD